MVRCSPDFLRIAAVLLSAVLSTYGGPSAPGLEENASLTGSAEIWIPGDICGKVLALSVDDAGRVFAAVTERSFGLGTVTVDGAGDLAREDRQIRSVMERGRLARQWLDTGRLNTLLASKEAFFGEPGDGILNFLTKYSESVRWLRPAGEEGGEAGPASFRTVADDFRDPVDGAGGALLALPNGSWLYGCPPVMWKLDGPPRGSDRSVRRTAWARDFGLRNGEASSGLHALLEAPDGWIYFGMGDRGYSVRTADGRLRRGLGRGAVFRFRPDGAELEIFATGLRNPTGLAMDALGHLFAVDQAAPGGRTRLLLVTAGADFGWQAERVTSPGEGVWFAENMESPTRPATPDQPLWCLPSLGVLEGVASTLESAGFLGEGVHLLAADARGEGKGGLFSLHLEEKDAAFRLVESKEVWRGGAVKATATHPDGSVYFADWGAAPGAFRECRVRRMGMDPTTAEAGDVPVLLKQIIQSRDPKILTGFLEHSSPRVRLRAGQRLAAMPFEDSMEPLLVTARHARTVAARVQSVWSAGSLARREPALLNELVSFLKDPESAVHAAAATMLGEGTLMSIPPALRAALTDPVPAVRLAAAAAYGRLLPPTAIGDLTAAAGKNKTGDPFIRSSLAAALAALPGPVLTEAGLASDSPEVRLTVVLALRRQASESLSLFLKDQDSAVVSEAARAIYDVPVFPALPALAALPDPEKVPPLPNAVLLRAIAAAVRGGLEEDALRISAVAQAKSATPAVRLAVLKALASWDEPPRADSFQTRILDPMPRLPGAARSALGAAARALADDPDSSVAAVARTISASPAVSPISNAGLSAFALKETAPGPVRLRALRSLEVRNALTPDTAMAVLKSTTAPPALAAEARSFLMRCDPKSGVTLVTEAFASGSVLEMQAAVRTLDHLPGTGNANEKLLLDAARRLSLGTIEPAVQVEVMEALQRRDIESRSPWRRATDTWLASLATDRDPLAPWRMALREGDAEAGRRVFETHPQARCTSCHSLNGLGGTEGPELDGVGTRLMGDKLLESLVLPSAAITPGWEIFMGPDPLDPAKKLSPMPPMGSLLTLRELRDLLTWLRTLKDG